MSSSEYGLTRKPLVLITDFVAYVDAFVFGWIVTDVVANFLLNVGGSFTKLRFFGTSFLSRREAILVAYGQVIVAMVISSTSLTGFSRESTW